MTNLRSVRAKIAAFTLALAMAACAPTPTPSPTAPPRPPTPTVASTATPRPATPVPSPAATGLTLLATDTVIRLTWPAQPGARGYFVFRDGATQPLHADALTTLTYEDIGLTNEQIKKNLVFAGDKVGDMKPESCRNPG